VIEVAVCDVVAVTVLMVPVEEVVDFVVVVLVLVRVVADFVEVVRVLEVVVLVVDVLVAV
jgi:hypothetical protein